MHRDDVSPVPNQNRMGITWLNGVVPHDGAASPEPRLYLRKTQAERGSSCGEDKGCGTADAMPGASVASTFDGTGISRAEEDTLAVLRLALSNSVKALTTGAIPLKKPWEPTDSLMRFMISTPRSLSTFPARVSLTLRVVRLSNCVPIKVSKRTMLRLTLDLLMPSSSAAAEKL